MSRAKNIKQGSPAKISETQYIVVLKFEDYNKLVNTCKLASELCVAIDAAENDIGGQRRPLQVLQELGPATDTSDAIIKENDSFKGLV